VPAPDAVQGRFPAPLVIAIDGPSGSGKSSVSREVARRLGLEYIDTGAMYRAVCWACLDAGIDLDDSAAVADLAHSVDILLGTGPDDPRVVVDGQEVTEQIRRTRISSAVSAVAVVPEVRTELRARQRQLIVRAQAGPQSGCVAEGRDITTVVAPDADVRLLLTASEQARLQRRTLQVHGTVDAPAMEATRDQVLRRDEDDATVSSFRVAADGVLELDSSALTFEQTVQAVLDAVARQASGHPVVELDLVAAEADTVTPGLPTTPEITVADVTVPDATGTSVPGVDAVRVPR
jgi:CMP/dCMP kinase